MTRRLKTRLGQTTPQRWATLARVSVDVRAAALAGLATLVAVLLCRRRLL